MPIEPIYSSLQHVQAVLGHGLKQRLDECNLTTHVWTHRTLPDSELRSKLSRQNINTFLNYFRINNVSLTEMLNTKNTYWRILKFPLFLMHAWLFNSKLELDQRVRNQCSVFFVVKMGGIIADTIHSVFSNNQYTIQYAETAEVSSFAN